MNKYQGQISYTDHSSCRLDLFLARNIPQLSRSSIQEAIRSENVRVNDHVQLKPNFILHFGDTVCYSLAGKDICADDLSAQNISLDIIFENNDVLVINKPPAMTIHPTPNNQKDTLVNALINYNPEILNAVYDPRNQVSQVRPGIVHRLDKDTTGVIIVAKNRQALHFLSNQIKNRSVIKKYLAICFGDINHNSGQWKNFLGRNIHNRRQFTEVGEQKGKIALTNYELLNNFYYKQQIFSMCEFQILTGRTHQIRAQSLLNKIPVLGDQIYYTASSKQASLKLGIKRQMLHSSSLTIMLPRHNKLSTFYAPVPDDFQNVIDILKNK